MMMRSCTVLPAALGSSVTSTRLLGRLSIAALRDPTRANRVRTEEPILGCGDSRPVGRARVRNVTDAPVDTRPAERTPDAPDTRRDGVTEERCAVHPARPAVDRCPVCGRPRCGADARSAPGGGCLQCGGVPTEVPPEAAGQREAIQVIAALLASLLLAELLAPVVSEYVGAKGF